VSRIGFCATEFDDDIRDMDGLLTALRSKRFVPRTFR